MAIDFFGHIYFSSGESHLQTKMTISHKSPFSPFLPVSPRAVVVCLFANFYFCSILINTTFVLNIHFEFIPNTMSIVIATPTANVGSVLTRTLLLAGEKLTIVHRDPAKVRRITCNCCWLIFQVKHFQDLGAVVVKGSFLEDQSAIDEALKGAKSLWWQAPPSTAPNFKYVLKWQEFQQALNSSLSENGSLKQRTKQPIQQLPMEFTEW